MKQKGAGSQCVRRTNIGSLSFRERYLSLRHLMKREPYGFPFFVPEKQLLAFFNPLKICYIEGGTSQKWHKQSLDIFRYYKHGMYYQMYYRPSMARLMTVRSVTTVSCVSSRHGVRFAISRMSPMQTSWHCMNIWWRRDWNLILSGTTTTDFSIPLSWMLLTKDSWNVILLCGDKRTKEC